MRSAAVAVVIALAATRAEAAPRQTITGTVIDGAGLPIEGAIVVGVDESATTAADGTFTVSLAADETELVVTAPGYSTRIIKLRDRKNLRVELSAASGAEVIDVTGKAPERPAPKTYKLSSADLRLLPGTANDALRAAQALPGVARLPYSFGGIVLRGTSPRDNAVYVDGIEVPFAFHFGGVTSFYPSMMLSGLTVSNGGLDAAYGRAQGGMVSLTTREPRTDKWRTTGNIGLLDAGAMTEGPVKGGGVILGVRRSYFDVVAAPLAPDDIPLPSYLDAQVKMSFGDPTKRGRITPMLFLSLDQVSSTTPDMSDGTEDESDLRAFFVRIAAPYKRQWRRLGMTITPWLGTNQLNFHSRTNGVHESFERPSYTTGVRTDLTRDMSWGELRGGIDFEGGHLGRYQAGFGHKGDKVHLENGETTVDWLDAAFWAESRVALTERLGLRPGVRLDHYDLTGEWVFDPRLSLTTRLTDALTLRQTVGRYHQPPTPGDVDINGGNPRLESSYYDAASVGIDGELGYGFAAALTGYYGYGQRIGVKALPDDPNFAGLGGLGPTFELLLEKQLGLSFYRENLGRARNAGAEVLLRYTSERWFGLVAYTLATAERTDDPRVGDLGWRPFELDQRHNLNVAASVALGKWRLGSRVHYTTGMPIAAPLSGQLPDFFQLDVRADRKWPQCWGDVKLYFDIQNITNRRNIEGRTFDTMTGEIKDVPGLPIAPFIGVELVPN